MPSNEIFQFLSTTFFSLAIVHTFFTGPISKLASKFHEGSVLKNVIHLLGEVEIVFGFWSAILVLFTATLIDFEFIINYLNQRNFTEALFVFVIMSVCSTRPILSSTEKILSVVSRIFPLNKNLSFYFTVLIFGSLLGSFITEPAAMTICAYLLLPRFFSEHHSMSFKYATLALLFINISIGGTLTTFAAPPILMVAQKWNWDLKFMISHFSIGTIISIIINTIGIASIFRKEISKDHIIKNSKKQTIAPLSISIIHFIFLGLIVASAHYSVLFIGIFLFFIGFLRATREYQSPLHLRQPLLVSFFLSGLIVLGGPQQWWLEPLISKLTQIQLYIGTIALTAFTDNAALTYLGTLIPSLSEGSKLALVKGSVVGGGLTLIANAPNPAGFGILGKSFSKEGFSPLTFFLCSLPLTISTALIFLFF